jgi:glutathione S-transferase
MQYVEIVAVLAVLQFIFFSVKTGRIREKSGVTAPAVTGHEDFERMYRVQMNTLELLISFFPVLFLSAKYWSPYLVSGLGAVYLIGRLIYWRAYVNDPSKRGLGFALSILPTLLLALLAFAGIILSLSGLKA